MFSKIIRYIFGTFEITVKDKDADKILSKIIKSEMSVKEIKKTNSNELSFVCYKRTFKRIKQQLLENNLSYSVHRRGLPMVLSKYKKRWGLPIGFVLFSVLFYIFSLFIWDVQVVGCEYTTEKDILQVLNDNGFHIGLLKSKIDASEIENLFLHQYDDVSWMSINIIGTTAFVEIRENVCKVERLDTSYPSNIYASRDGIIASVKDYMGYSVVNIGDTVTAGDLIVSGEYTDKYGKEYKLHSYASVMAYTTHSFNVSVPYKTYEQRKTGKYKNYYKINLIRFSLPLYFKEKISYNTYSINKSVDRFKLSDTFVLPFSIEKKTYAETEVIECVKSRDEAIADAYGMLYDLEYDLVGVKVLNRNYKVAEDETGITVTAVLDCYEDIGMEIKID